MNFFRQSCSEISLRFQVIQELREIGINFPMRENVNLQNRPAGLKSKP